MPVTLTPLHQFSDTAPVVIAPCGASSVWASCRRLHRCEVYALPAAPEIYSVWFWTPLIGRDVTFWPVDVASSQDMTLIVAELLRRHRFMAALRWAWGVPWADEIGEAPARIETLWKRDAAAAQKAA